MPREQTWRTAVARRAWPPAPCGTLKATGYEGYLTLRDPMLLEHLIYTTAFAILAGMAYQRWVGRDPSWIMIATTYAPDIDLVLDGGLRLLGFRVLFHNRAIDHGDLHTVLMLLVFAVAVAFLLHPFGIRFVDSFIFAGAGFGAHLLEDAFVYQTSYPFLWPLTSASWGFGWLPYERNVWGLANAEVLAIGLALVAIAALIRTRFEGTRWIRENVAVEVALAIVRGPEADSRRP